MGPSTHVNRCPLCGEVATAIQPHRGKGRAWNVGCGNEQSGSGCGLVLFGDYGIQRQEIVRRWNSLTGPKST